jgi:hypothetical protein
MILQRDAAGADDREIQVLWRDCESCNCPSSFRDSVRGFCSMGDESPKTNNKAASQKQAKSAADNQRKSAAAAAKAAPEPKK